MTYCLGMLCRAGAVSNEQIISKVMAGTQMQFRGWPFTSPRPPKPPSHTGRPAPPPPDWDNGPGDG